MDRFPCNGWLYINAMKTSPVMSITIRHDLSHVAYHNTELPERWKKYIEEHALSRTAGDVSSFHAELRPFPSRNIRSGVILSAKRWQDAV